MASAGEREVPALPGVFLASALWLCTSASAHAERSVISEWGGYTFQSGVVTRFRIRVVTRFRVKLVTRFRVGWFTRFRVGWLRLLLWNIECVLPLVVCIPPTHVLQGPS